MDNKLLAMEKCRESLERHFDTDKFRHDIMIPYIVDPGQFVWGHDFSSLSFADTQSIKSYRISFEDWYKFNKVKFYRQEFEDLVNE